MFPIKDNIPTDRFPVVTVALILINVVVVLGFQGVKGFSSVDAKTVRRIAHLARIAVTDDEVAPLQDELNAILAFVEQLSEVDVAGVEPMTSVTPMAMKKRTDGVTDGGDADAVLRNAPAREGNYFVVPKVVE